MSGSSSIIVPSTLLFPVRENRPKFVVFGWAGDCVETREEDPVAVLPADEGRPADPGRDRLDAIRRRPV